MDFKSKEKKLIKKLYFQLFGIPLITILILSLFLLIPVDEEEIITILDLIIFDLFITISWFIISSIIILIVKIVRRCLHRKNKDTKETQIITGRSKITTKSIIMSIVTTILLILSIYSSFKYEELTIKNKIDEYEYLEKYVKDNKCELIKENNLDNVKEAYHTSNECPLYISYAVFNDKNESNTYYNYIINNKTKTDGPVFTYIFNTSKVSIEGYSFTTNDNYIEVIIYNNIVSYFRGSRSQKHEIKDIAREIGYRPNLKNEFFKLFPLVLLTIIITINIWRLYNKIGSKGWKSLIPIYNVIELSKKVTDYWEYAILAIIPFVINGQQKDIILKFIFWIIIAWNLGNKYNKTTLYRLGLIFLPMIFIPLFVFEDTAIE